MTAREWQGRGLATTLGSVLVAASRSEGHRFWSAEILGTNQAAFTLVARLGRVERRRWDGSSVHVHIHLDG
jgi:L-amino acid N-acyltransferase YncA